MSILKLYYARFAKDVLQPNQIIRLKTLDRFASHFGNAPRRLNDAGLIYLLITVKNGYGNCLVDNEDILLSAGSVLLVGPYSYLHLENIKYILGSVIIFKEEFFCKNQFSENLLYKVVYDMENKPALQLNDDKFMASFIHSNMQMFASQYRMLKNQGADNDFLHNLLSGIVLMIHKLHLQYRGQKYDNENPHLKNKVVEFIKLLNIHFREHHQLEFYAAEMGVTVSALGKICKQACGWSPKAIIQSKLIAEAKILLTFDPRPLSDISFELGFQEHSTFSKFFKEELKIVPAEFKAVHAIKKSAL